MATPSARIAGAPARIPLMALLWRLDLRLACSLLFLLLAPLQRLLIHGHGLGGFFAIAGRLIRARQLVVEAAVLIERQRFQEGWNCLGVLPQPRERQSQRCVR